MTPEKLAELEAAKVKSEAKIGDRVRAEDPKGLFCGSGVYSYAIVVSLDPFVLSSSSGDMLWYRKKPADVPIVVGKASPLELNAAVGRFCIEEGLHNPRTGLSGEVRKLRARIAELEDAIRKHRSHYFDHDRELWAVIENAELRRET